MRTKWPSIFITAALLLALGGYAVYRLTTSPGRSIISIPLPAPEIIQETSRLVLSAPEAAPFLSNRWIPTGGGSGMIARDGASLRFVRFPPAANLSLRLRCARPAILSPIPAFEVQLNEHSLGLFSPGIASGIADATLPAEFLQPFENVLTFRATDQEGAAPGGVPSRNLNAAALEAIEIAPLDPSERRTEAAPAANASLRETLRLAPGQGARFRITIPRLAHLEWTSPQEASANPPSLYVHEIGGALREIPAKQYSNSGPWYAKPNLTATRMADVYFVNSANDPETASATITLASLSLVARQPPPHSDVNILLVVIDTLRADYLSCHGSGNARTPSIDALAASGIRFTRAFSHAPITGPSHTSLFTSRYGSDVGVTNNGQILPLREFCLAEAMGYTGRSTHGAVSLAVLKKAFEFDQGFDTYDQEMGSDFQVSAREINRRILSQIDARSAASGQAGPFFAFVHYSDPHEPYLSHGARSLPVDVIRNGQVIARVDAASESAVELQMALQPGENPVRLRGKAEFRLRSVVLRPVESGFRFTLDSTWTTTPDGMQIGRDGEIRLFNPNGELSQADVTFILSENLTLEEMRANYVREVEYVDAAFGGLVEALKDRGLYESTLVLLTSDHGEGLGDHGLIGHIDHLYDSLLHVPMILRLPGDAHAGARLDFEVGLVDVLPTLLDYLGLDSPFAIRGKSLLPLVSSERAEWIPIHFAETHRPEARQDKVAIRTDEWKYIRTLEPHSEELFNLAEDPEEAVNLVDVLTHESANLRKMLDLVMENRPGDGSGRSGAISLDPETREQLETLGYVHD